MVGMLQIMTYLLCLYLVFKGFEILQIALASPRENRTPAILIGVLFVVVSIAAASYFVKAIDEQAHAVGSRVPNVE